MTKSLSFNEQNLARTESNQETQWAYSTKSRPSPRSISIVIAAIALTSIAFASLIYIELKYKTITHLLIGISLNPWVGAILLVLLTIGICCMAARSLHSTSRELRSKRELNLARQSKANAEFEKAKTRYKNNVKRLGALIQMKGIESARYGVEYTNPLLEQTIQIQQSHVDRYRDAQETALTEREAARIEREFLERLA